MTTQGQPADRRCWLLAAALLVVAACCRPPLPAEPTPPASARADPVATTAPPATSAGPAPAPQPDPVEARAADLATRAAGWEPKVTPLVVDLAARLGGATYKLEFRLKATDSIIRKLRLRLSEGPAVKLSDVVIDDTLRYTLRFEDEPAGHHVSAIKQALAALAADGHQVSRLKNYWPADDNYSGVNCVLRTPDGLLWELQFHTTWSLEAAAHTRAWYEELRRTDCALPRKQELFDLMTQEWNKVPIPAGILDPGALGPHEEIRERPRP
ncbi:MAG: hypothetical protein JRI68_14470 [Deltaproteobacteria bacterium]|nr:hypothetical protein [Deltaproteobacteria bacterium]